MVAQQDPLGRIATTVYGIGGRVRATIDPAGGRTSYVYDVSGRRVAQIDALDYRWTTVYDKLGRNQATVNPLGRRYSIVYDAAGRPVSTQDPLGRISTRVYDASGRVLAVINPLNHRATFVYNATGQQIAVCDANENRSTMVYDSAGRAVAAIDARGRRVTSVFNALGQRIALVDANGRRTSFVYEPGGREAVRIDPLLRRTSYTYGAAGQRLRRLDARGILTTYVYDQEGRPTGRRPAGEAPVTFAYDATGNRTLVVDANGRTTTTFDAMNRASVVTNPTGQRITYAYDAVGQRAGLKSPDGGRFTYVYGSSGQLGLLVNPQGDRTTYAYDMGGQLTVQRLANGTRSSHAYDAAGQLASLANLTSSGSVLSSFAYSVDPSGNRTRVIEANGDRTTWTYDAMYQLTREHRTGVTAFCITHVYDSAGNRLQEVANGVRKTFTYDAANQLATSDDTSGRTTYVYDASGNLAIQAAPGGRTTNTWDAENRLLLVQAPAGIVNTMTYNSGSLRVTKADSSGTANYLWDGLILLSETDGAGNPQAVYTHEPAEFGGLVSGRRKTAGVWVPSYYHYDGLGSTDRLTDAAQSVTDSYSYYAYGGSAGTSSTTANPFRWVGQLGYHYDSDLAQYYVRARHYSPLLARWMSEDPIGYDGGINLYCYCGNDPTSSLDAYGTDVTRSVKVTLLDWTKVGKCGGKVGAVWSFKAISPQKGEVGYIVQRVYVRCTSKPCQDCASDSSGKYDYSYSYLEAWPVRAGYGGATDNADFQVRNDTSGVLHQLTEIIFVPKSDKINLETDPAWGRNKVHGPKDNTHCQTSSGPLLASDDNYLPAWWRASTAGRYFSTIWTCCCDKESVDPYAL